MHGQYGYSGHIFNLPQDVTSFIIIVRKEGSAEYHKDFRVRRSIVLGALEWLVTNNIYYRDVTIDHSVLSQLPIDGELTTHLPTTNISSSELDDTPPVQENDGDPVNAHLGSTFVLLPSRGMTEQLVIQQSILQTTPATPVVNWPSANSTPINEFTTEGYMSCAFPTLFPTGAADFLAPWQASVTIASYFKHMLLYHDGRFAKHLRFRFI